MHQTIIPTTDKFSFNAVDAVDAVATSVMIGRSEMSNTQCTTTERDINAYWNGAKSANGKAAITKESIFRCFALFSLRSLFFASRKYFKRQFHHRYCSICHFVRVFVTYHIYYRFFSHYFVFYRFYTYYYHIYHFFKVKQLICSFDLSSY